MASRNWWGCNAVSLGRRILRLRLLVGTTNSGKLIEIERILSGLDLDLRPLTDFRDAPEVVEDGLTYRDNAIKKARTIAAWSGELTLADDSGLEVAALGGEPGVHTARYGGPGLSPRERCLYLLERLRSVPDSRGDRA
jgi:XTP/dITP diphosphohydrolase